MNQIKEPILSKNESHPLDYKELTFKDFLIIQEVAQEVANKIGYAVYLVGSALNKHNPRDIDLSIIIPYEEFIKKYDIKDGDSAASCLGASWYGSFEDIVPLLTLGIEDYKIDLKITPNNWWTEKEKIILAKPIKK